MESSIRSSAELDKISLELAKISFKPIAKEGVNTQQNYKYARFEDFVGSIAQTLSTHQLFILTHVASVARLPDRPTRQGGVQYACQVVLHVRLMHASGQWLEIDAAGEGVDSQDKAIYKAITGARKYGLACLLGLATTDDPAKEEEKPAPSLRPPKFNRPAVPKEPVPTDIWTLAGDFIAEIKKAATIEELAAIFARFKESECKPYPEVMIDVVKFKDARKAELAK